MLICSVFGFFSICRKEHGALQIRARVRDDLENLLASSLVKCDIEETPKADYPFRIGVSEMDLSMVMATLAETVCYPSFTSALQKRADQTTRLACYQELQCNLTKTFPLAEPTKLADDKRWAMIDAEMEDGLPPDVGVQLIMPDGTLNPHFSNPSPALPSDLQD